MANMQKYNEAQVYSILRHNAREVMSGVYQNTDIDTNRSVLNFSIEDGQIVRGIEDERLHSLERFEERKSELYVYHRDDVNVMAEWIVTLPEELWCMRDAINRGEYYPSGEDKERVEEFFLATYDFLNERYGKENVIQVDVHFDEGRFVPLMEKDWAGNPVYRESESGKMEPVYMRDEDGKVLTEFKAGQPHLHYCFIPVVEDTKHADYAEKICANDLLNRAELIRFHPEFQEYMDEHGIDAPVHKGNTAINYTIQQMKMGMKEQYEHIRQMERQAERRW